MQFLNRSDNKHGRHLVVQLTPAYLWLTVAVFLPLSAMFYFSLLTEAPFGNSDWQYTFNNYLSFLETDLYVKLLWKSINLGLIVTFLCFVIGYPVAFVLAKTIQGRTREALFLLIILPFWSNSLVRVFSWAIVLRGNGVLDIAVNAVLPFDVQVNLMFTPTAIVIGLVHSYLPYMILTTYLVLQAIDNNLIDAARSMGASKFTILRRVIFPISLPGIIAGSVLIFVPVVGSFMEPRILGGRFGTYYGTVIEDQFVAVFNWPLGAALSFILLAVVLLILGLTSPILKRVSK